MKTVEELKKQNPVFLHNWKCSFDVIMDFENVSISKDESKALEKHKNDNILFASYNIDNWCGDAFVLFEREGVLYEINGCHCSCFGLEGQWIEEETSIEELKFRLINGMLGKDDNSGNDFNNELCNFLGI